MSGTTPPGEKAGDPSMDDILASIRKILDEEEGGAKPAVPVVDVDDVPLELTEAMIVDAPRPPPPVPTAPVVTAVEVVPPPPPAAPLAELPDDGGLVAPATAAAAVALIGQLARTVAQERAAPVTRGGPSIEDVVREEVRPLLREWLDIHLPPLVERLVRTEIERLVGRTVG